MSGFAAMSGSNKCATFLALCCHLNPWCVAGGHEYGMYFLILNIPPCRPTVNRNGHVDLEHSMRKRVLSLMSGIFQDSPCCTIIDFTATLASSSRAQVCVIKGVGSSSHSSSGISIYWDGMAAKC